ncbi:DUF1349 domain-containing protein [Cellulosilyticum sp. I15G10I2]|uniref:DUF1349 domain-containing protein n=1 Tax=Cellulosilyticum sp. I15G10I2 TaxID=1892843 RepID=UPI00085C8D14|nr:DUF1349 domain-containing protein [Cellulosilyticum sp. I15G10I2]
MNILSNCYNKTLPHGFAWMNEPVDYSFNENRLIVNAPPASDFFRDPAGNTIKDTAPYLYTEVEGDFVLTAKVDVEMIAEYDSGCLMVMRDEKTWAKVCYECIKDIPTIVSVVTKGTSDDCVSSKVGPCKPYLKIQKSGNCFGFHYSLEGITWEMVRYFHIDASDTVKVGAAFQSPIGQGAQVSFELLNLEKRTVKDVRVVADSLVD